jgi:asparagine synthase (glutamine-hydrolysing)
MCGICGVVGGDHIREQAQVAAMTAMLHHRGPNDSGVEAARGAVLGNRRLAILDLSSAGRQPLQSPDGRSWITYNGEVYNYRELRRELEADGFEFRTGTDTEVVLAMYLRHGRDCLLRLRGMFAFAIWDGDRQRLFAARDHFGQKPFYYTARAGRLYFSSEIKSLLAHDDLVAEPEPAAIDYYLSLRVIPPPLTMFRGIRKLPAAHWLEWQQGDVRVERYWTPSFGTVHGRSEEEWIEGLRERIEESVAAHTVSDVPVGAFLSGGLDSSVVVAAMARSAPEPVRTFCIGSDVSEFDERGHARLMAQHAGTQHHEACVSPALLGRIPYLVRALDEPSDPIAACFDEAARLASTHVKVALGGDGGDEVFAGFDRYAAFGLARRYAALPAWLRHRAVRPLLGALPEVFAYKSLSQKARWLDSVAARQDDELYARMTSHFRFMPEAKAALYGDRLAGEVSATDALEAVAAPFRLAPSGADLDRMVFADLMTRLPEHTLMLADRLSMAYGLEVRSPLLDVGLAEYCMAMPPGLRIRHGTTKYALRRAAEPWLPRQLLRRSKQGFMFPVAYWLDEQALRRVTNHMLAGPLTLQRWIKPEAIERLAGEHARRAADHHVRIWQLASLDAWLRIYLDGTAADDSDAPAAFAGLAAAS